MRWGFEMRVRAAEERAGAARDYRKDEPACPSDSDQRQSRMQLMRIAPILMADI
jgi:hypothetical protein